MNLTPKEQKEIMNAYFLYDFQFLKKFFLSISILVEDYEYFQKTKYIKLIGEKIISSITYKNILGENLHRIQGWEVSKIPTTLIENTQDEKALKELLIFHKSLEIKNLCLNGINDSKVLLDIKNNIYLKNSTEKRKYDRIINKVDKKLKLKEA